ncbi:MAG: N-acetyltransferase [Candidatus Sedimenticola sp. (ex Thyasira tokunagai)]
MKDIVIRKARIKDVDDIRNILLLNHKEDYEEWPSIYIQPDIQNGPSKKEIRKIISNKNNIILMACYNNNIIGIIVSELSKGSAPLKKKEYGLIKRLYVIKNQRERGIATKLIKKTKKHYNRKGVDEVRLHVFGHNKQALKLYTKLGFTYLVSLMTDCIHIRR